MRGQLSHFISLGHEVVAVSADGPEIDELEDEIPHHIVPLSRKITPFQDFYCILKLYFLIRREKPDIVHSHTPKAGLIGMISAFLARVPVRMHTVAGLPLMESTGLKRKVLVAVERLTYRFATNVYPNSYAMKDFIEAQIYAKPDKLKVIANGSSNGIDSTFFKPTDGMSQEAAAIREANGLGATDKVAVFVGRITKDKGINELVRAMKQVSGLKLLLVGTMEPELDPLEPEVVKEIEVNPDIVTVGFQKDVRPYLLASDFLVFPSYREGFPNVPMQAGAMGLPSIVTDINGCNEIITHETNGLIVPPKDERALVAAMKRILSDEELANAMQQQARKMITERYDQRRVWQALEEEYGKLVS